MKQLRHLGLAALLAAALPAALASPYNLLQAKRKGSTVLLLGTRHSSDELMQARMRETLDCLPELSAVATEIDFEQNKDFNLLNYGIEKNRTAGLKIPEPLVEPLDQIADRVLRPDQFPRKLASVANRLGIHPGYVLFVLRGKLFLVSNKTTGVFGPALDLMLEQYAQRRQLPHWVVEEPTAAPDAYFAEPADQIEDEAKYVIRLYGDRSLQEATYAAEDDAAELFWHGDWTTLDWKQWHATQSRDKSPNYINKFTIERTAGMARYIDAFPPQPKPVLVGVGLNHFGGPGGLEDELRKRGFSVSRHVLHCDSAPAAGARQDQRGDGNDRHAMSRRQK